jgi:hypothetical protein
MLEIYRGEGVNTGMGVNMGTLTGLLTGNVK